MEEVEKRPRRNWTDEQRKAKSELMKRLMSDPERRKRISETMRSKKPGTVGRPSKATIRKRLIARGRVEMSQGGRLRMEFESVDDAALWVVSHNFTASVDSAARSIRRECKTETGERIFGFLWRYI